MLRRSQIRRKPGKRLRVRFPVADQEWSRAVRERDENMNQSSKWARTRAGKFTRKPGSRIEKTCPVCAVVFLVWANRVLPARTCSRKCASLFIKKRAYAQGVYEDRSCKECEQSFVFQVSHLKLNPSRGQYCSAVCRNRAKVKRYDARGVSSRYKYDAHLKADKEWRKAVREKDDFTCQRCGKYDEHIHTHHVAPRGRRPDLIRVIENGKCLCASCHAWVHTHPIEATAAGLLSDEKYEARRA